ncbi:MAG: hypothetical protein DMG32_04025, partial [Acidobacteria bacterium]
EHISIFWTRASTRARQVNSDLSRSLPRCGGVQPPKSDRIRPPVRSVIGSSVLAEGTKSPPGRNAISKNEQIKEITNRAIEQLYGFAQRGPQWNTDFLPYGHSQVSPLQPPEVMIIVENTARLMSWRNS